jgi:hypothetical protein
MERARLEIYASYSEIAHCGPIVGGMAFQCTADELSQAISDADRLFWEYIDVKQCLI